jgi:hypothetical protein
MSCFGVRNWPPVWVRSNEHVKLIRAEIGTLKRAYFKRSLGNGFHLVMEYEGKEYMASISFDDAQFCQNLYSFLQSHTGRSIQEIGDLDLSFTL